MIVWKDVGLTVLHAVAGARAEIVIATAYVKTLALRTILDATTSTAATVDLYARWHPIDVLTGATDLEARDVLLSQIPHAGCYVNSKLHAKYIRVDDRCYIGSANITQRGLGLHQSNGNNLELIVEIERSKDTDAFEKMLRDSAVEFDAELAAEMTAFERAYRDSRRVPSLVPWEAEAAASDQGGRPASAPRTCWWSPSLRHPEDLHVVYGNDLALLSRTALEAAQRDLAALEVPLGLTRSEFDGFVRVALLRQPLVHRVLDYAREPRRFGEMRHFLDSLATAGHIVIETPTSAWQTLYRWLSHFLSAEVAGAVPRYSELFWTRRAVRDDP